MRLTGAIQHTGLGSSIPDWRLVCHTVKVNRLLGWLYWNMSYHTEHHMYAAVPFHNLARLRAAIEKDMPEAHPSLSACIRTLYEIKRKQRSDPNCVWAPAFPPGATPPRLR